MPSRIVDSCGYQYARMGLWFIRVATAFMCAANTAVSTRNVVEMYHGGCKMTPYVTCELVLNLLTLTWLAYICSSTGPVKHLLRPLRFGMTFSIDVVLILCCLIIVALSGTDCTYICKACPSTTVHQGTELGSLIKAVGTRCRCAGTSGMQSSFMDKRDQPHLLALASRQAVLSFVGIAGGALDLLIKYGLNVGMAFCFVTSTVILCQSRLSPSDEEESHEMDEGINRDSQDVESIDGDTGTQSSPDTSAQSM